MNANYLEKFGTLLGRSMRWVGRRSERFSIGKISLSSAPKLGVSQLDTSTFHNSVHVQELLPVISSGAKEGSARVQGRVESRTS